MQIDETKSPREHSIETLRVAWQRTQSGRTAEKVVPDNEQEVEYYLSTALFCAQMRLGTLRTKLDEVSPGLRSLFEAEFSAIEDELRVCAEGVTLILQK